MTLYNHCTCIKRLQNTFCRAFIISLLTFYTQLFSCLHMYYYATQYAQYAVRRGNIGVNVAERSFDALLCTHHASLQVRCYCPGKAQDHRYRALFKIPNVLFFCFSPKPYCVTIHSNRLDETIRMNGNTIELYRNN